MAQLQKQNVPFTQVANAVLNDPKLSWKAKGLFAYLFSKPEGWDFSAARMINNSNDGERTTKTGLQELEKAGYLIRERLSTGKVKYHLKFSKEPEVENQPWDEKAQVLKCPNAETALISNKEEKIINNENIVATQSVAEIKINNNSLIGKFKEVNPSYEKFFANKTQRAAIDRLVGKYGQEKVSQMIDALPSIIVKKFAPRITTPLQLETKLGDLYAFVKQQRSEPKAIRI